jgi:hypothetical protein
MGVNSGPQIPRSGLAAFYDMANPRSFRGVSTTNLIYQVAPYQMPQNAYYKSATGTESAFIPYFNQNVSVVYQDVYNDYAGGSGHCCPQIFVYHNQNVAVTGSTTYTYQIIFKTDTGYYHPNYLYRYEYSAAGSTLTEGGSVDASRMEQLGDGWIHAWGQFTTNANTVSLSLWCFHYDYAKWDRIRIYSVSLTQGTTIHRPEHFLPPRTARGTIAALGGGVVDMVGQNSLELFNGLSYDSGGGGSLLFDGTNDYAMAPTSCGIVGDCTLVAFFKSTSSGGIHRCIMATDEAYRYGVKLMNFKNSDRYGLWVGFGASDYEAFVSSNINDGQIHMLVGSWEKSTGTVRMYLDGVKTSTISTGVINTNVALNTGKIVIGAEYYSLNNSGTNFKGNIYSASVYSRVLSDSDVLTLYNSFKIKVTKQTTRNTTLVRQTPKGSVYSDVALFLDPANRSSYSPGSSKMFDLSTNQRTVTFYTAGGGTHTSNAAAAPPFSTDGKGSFVFDGSNDFGKLSSTFTTTTNITVSVWVKTTATGERGILSHCSGGPVGEGYSLYDGKMKYWYYSGSWQTLDGNTLINDGAWNNLVWVKTGTNMKMYVDGVLDKEATLVASITSTFLAIGTMWGPCSSLNYGAGSDYYSTSFSGNMGPLKVWTRALSATEVTEMYERFKGRFGEAITGSGLITHVDSTLSYPGSGATWTDLSGSGNNVTLYNSPAYSNGVLGFDGVTEYFVSNVNVGAANTSFTFGGFVKVKASTVANSFIFSNYHATSGVTPFYAIAYNGSGPTFLWFRDSTGNTNTQGAQVNLSLNQWYYIVCVRNHATNQILLYVNGVLCDTTTFSGSHAVNNGLNLGGILHVNSTYINSDMGSLKVYNRALTSNEVMRNFMLTRSRFGVTGTTTAITKDLMMYFDAKLQSSYSGNIWYDISGSANHATLVGSPTWNSDGYLVFDGVDDRATIPFNSTSMAAWSSSQTVIFWAYHTFTTERRNLWNQAYGGYGTWTHEPGSYFNYFYGDGGADTGPYTSLNSTVGSSTPTGVWNMYAITRDTSTVRFYINGSLDTTQANPYADLAATTAAVSIAYGYTGVYWAGRIAVVMAYTRALTAADILWNYNFYKGRFGRA